MKQMTSLVAFALLGSLASAEIPQMISYQGKVTDTSGNPVADGSYTMRFRIYDAATVGTLKWDSGAQTVAIADGVFSVLLGESPQPALSLDFSQDYWLLVTFNAVDQTPRQRMASAGYAYMASGLVAGTEVSGAVTSGTNAAIKGVNQATTGATYGVWGESTSPIGMALYGYAAATTGDNYGVYGYCRSNDGMGVYGLADATTGTTYGVFGSVASTNGRAICGEATATSGGARAVYGRSYSSAGTGVYGYASAASGLTYGVIGTSASSDGTGVYGGSPAYGVVGVGGSEGIEGAGVRGVSQSLGVPGVVAEGFQHGYPTEFSTALLAYGDFAVFEGSKSCVVKTSMGPKLLYCQESPENWFEDFGEGRLVNGECHIELDALFLETVTINETNPMKVFVELNDRNCRGVAVEKGTTGFDVIELWNGASNGAFDYRVVAKRKGFEEKRLDECRTVMNDPRIWHALGGPSLEERGGNSEKWDSERVRAPAPAEDSDSEMDAEDAPAR